MRLRARQENGWGNDVRATRRIFTASASPDSAEPSRALKVLHVLDHFLPISSGYTFRTHYLLESQRRILGVEPVVLVSPQHVFPFQEEESQNGIRVYHTPSS